MSIEVMQTAPYGLDAGDDIDRRTTLQRIVWGREPTNRSLYWTARSKEDAETDSVEEHHGAMRIGPGSVVSFNTYFNAFFEQNWRLYTRLDKLVLQAEIDGDCTLRIVRNLPGSTAIVAERRVIGATQCEIPVPKETLSFRQHGLLALEILARSKTTVTSAAWVTSRNPRSREVGLAVVFCTFNREVDIEATLGTITADPRLLDGLARVYVVNQGRSGLAARPGMAALLRRMPGKIRIVEQSNFGGAGGFSRGLLAALNDPLVTHVAFLDDDVTIEPESLNRMIAFFGLANSDRPIGGHMLDRVQPRRVYEAGAVIDPHDWSFHPQLNDLDLDNPDALTRMLGPSAIHYNGWWLFAFSLDLVRTHGMPLPCFIRGDDLEFGLRLYRRGVHTIPLPGIAVWHEPFYLKTGGWQLYYETRNMLVAAALHFGTAPAGAAVRIARLFLIHLLTFRYYSAALILRGAADFLRGPALWDQMPEMLHGSLGRIAARFPQSTVTRETLLPSARPCRLPRGRIGYGLALVRALIRNAVRASPGDSVPRRIEVARFSWIALIDSDCIALDNWWDRDLPVHCRDRVSFFALGLQATVVLMRLARRFGDVALAWRAEAPRLTSPERWRDHLGVAQSEPRDSNGRSRLLDPVRHAAHSRDASGQAAATEPGSHIARVTRTAATAASPAASRRN